MTVFGWDASDFDWSRGPMNLAAAHSDGIAWFTHKATEGATIRHIHYGAALTRARDAGIPVLGAYHVVRSAGALSAQVKAFLAYLDEATPWWRAHPNFFLQVDLELWSYDAVAASTGTAFAEQLAAATGHAVIIYASKGQYGNALGGSRPLWNANYPSSRSGGYASLYAAAGGDHGPGWASYSGRVPVFWQYTSSATIGTQPGCDANAFRGSLDELLTLTSGGSVHTIDDVYNAVVSIANGGQPPTGHSAVPDWVKTMQTAAGQTATVAASVQALQADVAELKAEGSTVTLVPEQMTQLLAALQGLVPTLEELRGIVDAAVKARLDGSTIHTVGS